jgi:hypothetical protein
LLPPKPRAIPERSPDLGESPTLAQFMHHLSVLEFT